MNINLENERNLSMLVDFYEFTMSNTFFVDNQKDKIVCFDMFFRKSPDDAQFSIAAGLEQFIEYVNNMRFTSEDIDYLRKKNLFNEGFLEYLKKFKFTGDIYAVKEGSVVFPNEPIVTVKAPVIEAQLIETMLLLTINHQSLIATKANRIVRAAKDRTVLEFGARRAQGYDAAILGARAAYIGGVHGSATALSDIEFNVPASGTMAHSFIQLYNDEYEAFSAYAKHNPDNTTLLVDTYNVLESGIPNAIRVAKEVLEPMGKRLKGVRLDSGDLTYLSNKSRKMLDEAGLEDCKIVASNSLDEKIISELLNQKPPIDIFGVGERLITSKSQPVFGGVYKLCAVEENGELVPRIKISENVEKVTNPGYKTLYRFYDKDSKKAIGDVIALHDEIINKDEYEIFDPIHTWKRKILKNFEVRKMQIPIFIKGECVYESPSIQEIREYCESEVESLWDEVKRFVNPQEYYVDLSQKLYDLKQSLLKNHSFR